jgi:hypothetical protein
MCDDWIVPRRSSRAKAEWLLATVKRHIDAADPEGLLRTGSPEDEYDQEISRIAARINSLQAPSAEAVEHIIYEVWHEMFSPQLDGLESVYRETFRPIAAAILADLRQETPRV